MPRTTRQAQRAATGVCRNVRVGVCGMSMRLGRRQLQSQFEQGSSLGAGEPLPRLRGHHFQKRRPRAQKGGPRRIEGEECGVHMFCRKFFGEYTEPARLAVAASLPARVCPRRCCPDLELRGGGDWRAERPGTPPFLCLQLHIRRGGKFEVSPFTCR